MYRRAAAKIRLCRVWLGRKPIPRECAGSCRTIHMAPHVTPRRDAMGRGEIRIEFDGLLEQLQSLANVRLARKCASLDRDRTHVRWHCALRLNVRKVRCW